MLAAGFAAAVPLVAPSVVLGASDVFSNIAPAQQAAGGLFGEYPLGNYALDSHFSAVSVGLFSGVDVSGVPPMIAFFLANTIWQLTAFLANSVITLFTFAFSLDLLNGSTATGGAGALAPVSGAVASIYHSVFGQPWLVVAIVLTGLWAMWKALIQRRYTETAGALALSTVFVLIALLLVTQPQRTIGTASRWTNAMSAAFLSLTDRGTLNREQQAKQADADQLFQLLVYEPWVVLQFGGLEHCVATPVANPPVSVAVQPLSPVTAQNQALTEQLQAGTEVQAPGKACVNNAHKYAAHFLAYPPGSDERNSEYQALTDGNTGELPTSDPGKTHGYQLGPADEPAADTMGKDGQYQRLLLALVVLAGELGAFLLLGVLSIGVILAQIIVLLLLAFAPVALVIAVFPGRGHDYFRGWLARLATFLLRKAIYSLVLAVLLAVVAALTSATASLGWLLSFALDATFFWTVFLYRHQLTGQITYAATGHNPTRDPTVRLASLYYATRLTRRHRPVSSQRSADPQPPDPPDAPPTSNDPPPASPNDTPPRSAFVADSGAHEPTASPHDHDRPRPQRKSPTPHRKAGDPRTPDTTGPPTSSPPAETPRVGEDAPPATAATRRPPRASGHAVTADVPAPATPPAQSSGAPQQRSAPVTRLATHHADATNATDVNGAGGQEHAPPVGGSAALFSTEQREAEEDEGL